MQGNVAKLIVPADYTVTVGLHDRDGAKPTIAPDLLTAMDVDGTTN